MPDEKKTYAQGELSFYLQYQIVNAAKKSFLLLAAFIKNASLYPPAHPFLLGSAEQLLLAFEELFASREELAYWIVSGELYFEKFSIPLEEKLSELVEEMSRRDIRGIVFQRGLKRDELVVFVFWYIRSSGKISIPSGQPEISEQNGVTHIKLHSIQGGPDQGNLKHGLRAAQSAAALYLDGIETVKQVVQSIQLGKPANTRKIHEVIRSVTDNILENRDALVGLTSIKLYDEYTFAHSVNVAILATAMGSYLLFEKSQIAILGIAGLLHDIGKVNIPLDILNKSGPLTDPEWQVIQRHPVEGAIILSGLPGVGRSSMVTAFEHHRRFDCKGYPSCEGEEAPLQPFSQIVAIADAYDAVTSLRVYYRIKRTPDEAIRLLLDNRGSIFNPVLVKTFVNMIGLFPTGTLLRLDTGETGLVVHQTRDLLRPRILLLRTFDGTETEEVSLLEMSSGVYKRTAVGALDPNAVKIDVKQYFTRA